MGVVRIGGSASLSAAVATGYFSAPTSTGEHSETGLGCVSTGRSARTCAGNTGTQPYIFGERIYWISADVANGARGNPLKSCALDGTDVQVIDDCDSGDTELALALE